MNIVNGASLFAGGFGLEYLDSTLECRLTNQQTHRQV
jgi:hypothetical protein